MKQITYELFQVNKTCRVKFSLVVKNGDDKGEIFTDITPENKFGTVLNKYVMNDNIYYKLVPHPRVIIDISPKGKIMNIHQIFQHLLIDLNYIGL